MPIYEYYCPDNETIYQFYARTLAQGASIPRCPDNPAYRMERIVSTFAITGGKAGEEAPSEAPAGDPAADPRMEAAMNAMESEFSNIDENDPRAMGRMMRRLSELTGEKIDGELEEVVRKLEEGKDPEELEESLGGADEPDELPGAGPAETDAISNEKERPRRRVLRRAPRRDPKLYDYET